MAQERVRRQPRRDTTRTRTDTAADDEEALAEARRGGADLDHLDAWLDEIDEILQQEAEFAVNFVQKGGE